MKEKLSYKMKLNILLLVYSTMITLMVLFLSFLFITKLYMPLKPKSPDIYYSINLEKVTFEEVQEISGEIVTSNELKKRYNNEFIKVTIIVMLLIFMLVIGFSPIIGKLISKRAILPFEKLALELEGISINKNIRLDEDIFVGELEVVNEIFKRYLDKIEVLMKEANILNSYITHEQKNALAVLRGKIQLGEYNKVIPLIDNIVSSLDDILALNAPEDYDYEVLDLALVSAKAVDFYCSLGSEIVFNMDDENSLLIKGNEVLIYRAICNLIENAIKYGGDGEITVDIYNKNDTVILTVEDNGEGIDIEKVDKIFDYKYRGENLKKDGYGIGLSLVNHVVNIFHGVTWVESKRGKGSKFYITFKELKSD